MRKLSENELLILEGKLRRIGWVDGRDFVLVLTENHSAWLVCATFNTADHLIKVEMDSVSKQFGVGWPYPEPHELTKGKIHGLPIIVL
jgi:hypothetical protein